MQHAATVSAVFFAGMLSLIRKLFTPLLALLLVFEEWGWEPLARLLARLARLPLWNAVERWIQRLPRWAALMVFAVPLLALLPIKLLALYLFGAGNRLLGLAVLLGAKLLGTAIVARLFQLTQPALMTFPWFAHWYPRWTRWKDALISQIRASFAWRYGRMVKHAARRWLRRFWQTR